MLIKTLTWDKDSHELFDYDFLEMNEISYKTNTSGYLIRELEETVFKRNTLELESDSNILLKLECNEDQFFIRPNFTEKSTSENIWYSIKYLNHKKTGKVFYILLY